MKRKIITLSIIWILVLLMSSGVLASSESIVKTHTVYFGGGNTDSIATASSSITPGTGEVDISCYTSASEIYQLMTTEMELYKKIGSSWVFQRRFPDSASNTSYTSDSETVSVNPGEYKLITYHYIYNPGDEADTYTYPQSVSVD